VSWLAPTIEDRSERLIDSPLGFDELHKYRNWRNYLKGIYDEPRRMKKKILVTGSARLDLYPRGGDSLQGRYHYLRLHPLSVADLRLRSPSDFRVLLELSGFLSPSSANRRWKPKVGRGSTGRGSSAKISSLSRPFARRTWPGTTRSERRVSGVSLSHTEG